MINDTVKGLYLQYCSTGCVLAYAPKNALTTKIMRNVKTLIPGQYGKAKSSTTSQDFEKAFPKD
jgi:hypothetical protein